MKVKIVCDGWRGKDGKPVDYNGEARALLLSQYHAGTTFDADIELDSEEDEELNAFLMQGFSLQVYVLPASTASGK